MLLKTLKYILPKANIKILGAGRTDAKVSALAASFELFTNLEIDNFPNFLLHFNENLPADIRVISCVEVDDVFNIIKDIRQKEYHYYFSFGNKNHPFCAAIMANILADLDIELMSKASKLFMGTHNFKSYTVRHKSSSKFIRKVDYCTLEPNVDLTASFFPDSSYVFKIKAEGFLRYQIRMIMGALIQLGKGDCSFETIVASLREDSQISFDYIAPASGLVLMATEF